MLSVLSRHLFIYLSFLSIVLWELIKGENVNGLGSVFIGLTLYLNLVCILTSMRSVKPNLNLFLNLLILMSIILTGVFTTDNMLLFYILFESSLIPIFLLVVGWGSREEKVRAGYYLFFFTLISSLLMLLTIIKLYWLTGSLSLSYLKTISYPITTQKWSFICFALAMAVKMPMFPFHIWLPQAHVEAPLAGSILLAGILLKLGGYGFIYLALPLFPFGFYYFGPLLQWMSMLGIVYGGLSTLRQSDMKRLIAYSSVAHMGFATFALFSIESEVGILSAILIFIAHGFVSPALFIVVGLLYERYGTRIIRYYKGVGVIMPVMNSFAFLFTLCSIAFPGSLNFIGEFLVVVNASQTSILHVLIISLGAFIGLKYALYFYERVFTGEWSKHLMGGRELNKTESYSLLILFLPTIIYGILPWSLISLF